MEHPFKEIPCNCWNAVFDRIGKDRMLICASDGVRENAMTASWGGIGTVWNRPVAVCLIRPERFTFSLVEKSGAFSLAFLPPDRQEALLFCGRESGRTCPDKFAACGLTVGHFDGVPFPNEAETVLICHTLYASDLRADGFVDPEILQTCYRSGGLHRVSVGGIEKVLKNS